MEKSKQEKKTQPNPSTSQNHDPKFTSENPGSHPMYKTHALPAGSTLSPMARPLFHNTRLAKKSSSFLAETDTSWGSSMCGTPTPSARLLLAIADGPRLGGRLAEHLWCLWKTSKVQGEKQP